MYRYTDIWGNTRITYADDNNDGNIDASLEIRREQNYYPFGLEHKGYNSITSGVKNNLKTYQGQEFTEDLGLNTHEWRYRISDPAIGRFWQVDPLAENYMYNSTYAFQENKMGMGVELEGRELGFFSYQGDLSFSENLTFQAEAYKSLGSNLLDTAELLVNPTKQGEAGVGLIKLALGLQFDTVDTLAPIADAIGTTLENGISSDPAVRGGAHGDIASFVIESAVGGELLKATKATKAASNINGVTGHTKHGLNQSISRNGGKGVNVKAKFDAIKNPKSTTAQSGGRTKYKGKNATVITNSQGKIITTFGKSRGPGKVPQGRPTGGGKAQRRNIKETGASYNPNQIK